jgi:hypothetical protein
MGKAKMPKIVLFYGASPFGELLKRWYLNDQLSSNEISEKIYNDSGIFISARFIQKKLKYFGLTRSLSNAFNVAIKKGRKSYKNLTKPIKSKEFRKGIALKVRYEILKRDNFKRGIILSAYYAVRIQKIQS